MSGDMDNRAVWDDALAHEVLGKVLLVGLTYLSVEGAVVEQQQFYGSVLSVHPRSVRPLLVIRPP